MCDNPILSLILIFVEIRYKKKYLKKNKVKYYGRRK